MKDSFTALLNELLNLGFLYFVHKSSMIISGSVWVEEVVWYRREISGTIVLIKI